MSETIKRVKLARCPFCGRADKLGVLHAATECAGHTDVFVVCRTPVADGICNARGPVRDTRRGAMAAWNRRAHGESNAVKIARDEFLKAYAAEIDREMMAGATDEEREDLQKVERPACLGTDGHSCSVVSNYVAYLEAQSRILRSRPDDVEQRLAQMSDVRWEDLINEMMPAETYEEHKANWLYIYRKLRECAA